MKERAKELKVATGKKWLLAKIAEMEESDRVLAEQLHVIISASAPALSSRTW